MAKVHYILNVKLNEETAQFIVAKDSPNCSRVWEFHSYLPEMCSLSSRHEQIFIDSKGFKE